MSIRYIFNTSGEYVAFLLNKQVFSPYGEWLGYLPQANIVYNTDGTYMGEISNDDRIIRNKHLRFPKLPKPLQPIKPMCPMNPMRRLKMPRLPQPYEDVFETTSGRAPKVLIDDFSYLFGASIWGSDLEKTFLGTISNNRFDQQSILNIYGNFGSKYSQTSIFNPYSLFGSAFGEYSALNKYSNKPPQIIKNNNFVAWLTVNQYMSGNKIDTNKFFRWLGTLN